MTQNEFGDKLEKCRLLRDMLKLYSQTKLTRSEVLECLFRIVGIVGNDYISDSADEAISLEMERTGRAVDDRKSARERRISEETFFSTCQDHLEDCLDTVTLSETIICAKSILPDD